MGGWCIKRDVMIWQHAAFIVFTNKWSVETYPPANDRDSYFIVHFLLILSVCMSLCVCVWAMLPDSNRIMMMMMMIVNPVDHRSRRSWSPLSIRCPIWSDMTSVNAVTQWREDWSSASAVSHTLFLPTLLSDSQVSISLVIHGLWWTVSEQVKAHAVLTCTNGVSPNHLPVIAASDRPWTILLSTCAH